MECAVCYSETGPFQNLCCGHTFCAGCVKSWYLKGVAGASCPMCRRPMYFRGFHKAREQWNEEAYESRCADTWSQAIDTCIEEAREMSETFPDFADEIMEGAVVDVIDLERTFRFLKNEFVDPEDIEYVLLHTDDYYSDRHMDRTRWIDEPRKEPEPRYPKSASRAATQSPKRCRARPDSSYTLSFYIVV